MAPGSNASSRGIFKPMYVFIRMLIAGMSGGDKAGGIRNAPLYSGCRFFLCTLTIYRE